MTRDEMLMYPDEYRVMFEMEQTYWWYSGVHSLLKHLLDQCLPARERAARLLDVGCGTGANLLLLREYGDAWGIDLAEEALQLSRARGIAPERTLLASAKELAFRDNQFDLAMSFDVICNITDDVAAMADVARVLKPGGRFIILQPAYRWLWSMHDVATGHQYRYHARDLRAKLTRAGLRVERVSYVNTLLFPAEAAQRLVRRVLGLDKHKPVHSDLKPMPPLVNALLAMLFRVEARIAARIDLPFGLSVFAVGRKILNSKF